jgi:hypothetical protein
VVGVVPQLHSALYLRTEHLARESVIHHTVRTPGQSNNLRDRTVSDTAKINLPNSRAMTVVPQAHSVMATQTRYDDYEVFIWTTGRG